MHLSQPYLCSDAFDYVLIVDRFVLTGAALADLSARKFPRAICEHISTFHLLRRRIADYQGYRILVVMELLTDTEPLSEGLSLLTELKENRLCRVMVCTDLSDPLLLRVILGCRPTALALRTDPVSVLQACILKSGVTVADDRVVESTGVKHRLASEINKVELTPRELQWLIASIDGHDLQSAAVLLGVGYKTVATFSQKALTKMGIRVNIAFTLWLTVIEKSTGKKILKGEG